MLSRSGPCGPGNSRMARRAAVSLASVRSLIADAELPAVARMCSAVPVSRRSVLPWRHALLGVAERLERDEPVDPCGVARVMVLITDGCSPVYNPDATHSMGDAIWWVADGLKLPGAAD